MRGRTGTSTIYTTILPKQSYLNRICTKKLSKEAKHRLKIIDYFFLKANKNISLTARHFGVTRGYVYKWLSRFNPKCLKSLEDRSRRPKQTRKPLYDWETIALIRKYREDKDTCAFSAKKLAAIIKEDLIYYVNRWLNNSHFLRPHQSLNYETPAAYCAKMGITIYRREVYMM